MIKRRFGKTNKWIPIEKGYPNEPRDTSELKQYIVTCRGFAGAIGLTYMGGGRFEDINGHDELYDVIAWMPMPKVYGYKG